MNGAQTQFKKGHTPWNKGATKVRTFNCINCGKEKSISDNRSKESRNAKFCSTKCRDEAFVPLNKGVPIPEEQRKKMLGRKFTSEHITKLKTAKRKSYASAGKKRPHLSGENSPHWIEDRTQLVKSEKKHLDGRYREWMLGVKERDNWKCKISNSGCNGRLESHHILDWANYPELRYKLNNGIALCHAHHPRGRAKEKRLVPIFQGLASVSKE